MTDIVEADKSGGDSGENVKNNESQNKENLKIDFRCHKNYYGAVTWFVCAVLIVPCYMLTKIWAMAAMLPFLLLMGIGGLLEASLSFVKIDGDMMEIENHQGFRPAKLSLPVKQIQKLSLDVTDEKKEEIIHSITLRSNKEYIKLPDLDKKPDFIEAVKKIKPDLKIEKNL